MKTYHLGLTWSDGYYKLQAADNVDLLSCEINAYLGRRITTKNMLKCNKRGLIDLFNTMFNKSFTKITII